MRGKKTTEADKEKVRAVLYLNPEASNKEIVRQTQIPESTLRGIKNDIMNSDEFETVRTLKKQEFINEAWEFIKKSLKAANIKVDQLLAHPEQLDKTRLTDLSLSVSQIYDKQALASGEPTIISERQEPTPDLVKELEQKVAKLKQMTGT